MSEGRSKDDESSVTRRTALKATGTAALASGAFAASAAARNPHCIKNQTFAEGPDDAGNLKVCFKIAGLGNEDVIVTVSADATACYACRNKGGNFPQDPKKQQVEEEVKESDRFTPENGNVQDCLMLSPPPTDLNCPGNQEAVLVSVSYTNVRIVTTDAESGEVLARCRISGTFSRTFVDVERAQCD